MMPLLRSRCQARQSHERGPGTPLCVSGWGIGPTHPPAAPGCTRSCSSPSGGGVIAGGDDGGGPSDSTTTPEPLPGRGLIDSRADPPPFRSPRLTQVLPPDGGEQEEATHPGQTDRPVSHKPRQNTLMGKGGTEDKASGDDLVGEMSDMHCSTVSKGHTARIRRRRSRHREPHAESAYRRTGVFPTPKPPPAVHPVPAPRRPSPWPSSLSPGRRLY